MWQVKLTKPTPLYHFRSDYFPRNFYYKRNANELMREVIERGGEAVVVNIKVSKPEPSKAR